MLSVGGKFHVSFLLTKAWYRRKFPSAFSSKMQYVARKFHRHCSNCWRIWVEQYVNIFLITDAQCLQCLLTDAKCGRGLPEHLWSYISSMRSSASSPDETPRRELTIPRAAECFWRSSMCFIWWWNTRSNAWYYSSDKMILEREIKDTKICSFLIWFPNSH